MITTISDYNWYAVRCSFITLLREEIVSVFYPFHHMYADSCISFQYHPLGPIFLGQDSGDLKIFFSVLWHMQMESCSLSNVMRKFNSTHTAYYKCFLLFVRYEKNTQISIFVVRINEMRKERERTAL